MDAARAYERAVIAILLQADELFQEALTDGLIEDHFEDVAFKRIFRAMEARKKSGAIYGVVSLSQALPDLSGLLFTISSEEYLGGLATYLPGIFQARRNMLIQRELSEITSRLARHPNDEPFDIESALKGLLTSIDLRDTHKLWSLTTTQAVATMEEVIAERRLGHIGQETGIRSLNAYFNGGLQPSQLVTIGARPGMGKTTLALQIALEAARSNPVGFVTVEMTADDLMASAVSYLSKVDSQNVRNGYYPLHGDEVAGAKERLKALPLYTFESCGNFERVQIEIRRLASKIGCKLIVVDYLQILRAPGRGSNRLEELTYISGTLKGLALELRIPILACAQLNRMVEGRRDDIPRLSDFRESGSIEQDSDGVIFVQRATTESAKCAVDLIVAKNRRGRTGVIKCSGDYSTGRIWEI